jgi:hypothetical protein
MASRRTTFDKLQRERAKKAKAAMKRERRQERGNEADETVEGGAASQDTPDELLAQIARLHARFDNEEIEFEEFEELKLDLFERLAALPIDS